ncbi:MAG: HAD family hydrolase [Planctomycetaceae bacterium]|nr:HAD family hydrolase [Planctomycetaceae bacterium]MCB9952217.1 HAD family hydrolase [Planctomycetaceae bacterium]
MDAHVFDIDGTLLESSAIDTELFVTAIKTVLGVSEVNTNWSSYPHVTDQAIVREIMRIHDIEPREQLLEDTKQEFVSLLTAHINATGPFPEIPGATRFMANLIASQQHFVAYATGGWRESALLKLTTSGFPVDGVRLSTSSEFEDRQSIMRAALAGAPCVPEKVTYYGDGVWDKIAAHELGWNFVPVGATLNGIRDFTDVASLKHS